MLKLLKRMRKREVLMCFFCAAMVLGQIYFDLKLPDYMSELTVLIQTPGREMSAIWSTGLEMLACVLAGAVLCILCGYLSARAASVCRRYDKKRANYYAFGTSKKWNDMSNYDMILDSSKIGINGCVNAISALLDK